MAYLCRHCHRPGEAAPPSRRCPACLSRMLIAHDELFTLTTAHLDCDAFYASVEKRDDPSLRDKAVIVGGGRRGVVATCCYIARISGVRSAMPMFQALKLCPDAVVIAPRISHYAEVSRAIRAKMETLTPVIEPLSLDEAYLDLHGTERLHGAPPAVMLARLASEVEQEIGITLSIGLSHNRFLAKIASDLDKPNGFSLIGRAETLTFLQDKPVGILRGVGQATQSALAKAGIRTVADLRAHDLADLTARFGQAGVSLYGFARGEDSRPITADAPMRSLSKETTFEQDLDDPEVLQGWLWHLAEQASARAKAKDLAGRVVTLKLKTRDFTTISRRHSLNSATQSAETIYHHAAQMFAREQARGPFRLIGTGISDLCAAAEVGREGRDLLDPDAERRAKAEAATDAIRARFGTDAIMKGRSLRRDPKLKL